LQQGRIKKLISDRGFGFIEIDGKEDIFFHHSGVLDAKFEGLEEGDKVSFEVEQNQKGPRAVEVQKEK